MFVAIAVRLLRAMRCKSRVQLASVLQAASNLPRRRPGQSLRRRTAIACLFLLVCSSFAALSRQRLSWLALKSCSLVV